MEYQGLVSGSEADQGRTVVVAIQCCLTGATFRCLSEGYRVNEVVKVARDRDKEIESYCCRIIGHAQGLEFERAKRGLREAAKKRGKNIIYQRGTWYRVFED